MNNISKWDSIRDIPSQNYVCSYCNKPLASDKGWIALDPQSRIAGYVCVCHLCRQPTYIDVNGEQHPGVIFGNPVKHIPDESIKTLYDEARQATGIGSYTAAVLCCRKLLMHIAVSKGAKSGESFVSYVEYLANNHYVPPDAKEWVDHIRTKSNEANHEIVIMGLDDAKELLNFSEMLLKVIYEFPALIKSKVNLNKAAT
ncbi:MAG: DUF4145 domain-containing protein [Chloroflexota bacterium]